MSKDSLWQRHQLSEAHIYLLGREKKWTLLLLYGGVLLIQQAISLVTALHHQDVRHVYVNIGIIVLFCLCGVLIWRASARQRLIVGSEGVIYKTGAYTLYSPWDNIHKVVISPHNGVPALWLQHPAEPLALEQGIRERHVAIEYRRYNTPALPITSRYDLHNYIPLPAKKDRIWQDVQQHVPDLEMTILD